MLNKILQFFDNNIAAVSDANHEQSLQLATAALFVEMIQQDGKVVAEEKRAVKTSLKQCFNLSELNTDELFNLAEAELNQSTDYYQFTQLINKYFDQPSKLKIVENLWRIAYSDNHLDELEEHMVRKIAELIHVPHRHFIQTKLKAQKQLGTNGN